jgi:hypothetical protein
MDVIVVGYDDKGQAQRANRTRVSGAVHHEANCDPFIVNEG